MIKTCPDCGIDKEFKTSAQRCRECAKIVRKEKQKLAHQKWASNHPDKVKALNKRYYSDNREREKARAQQWRDENPERLKESQADYRAGHREERIADKKRWYAENIEWVRAYRRLSYIKNKDRENALGKLYKQNNKHELRKKEKEYRRAHPELNRWSRADRRAAEKKATPPWVDRKAIRDIFKLAIDISLATGIPHHVDHKYPLNPRSKTSCGLNVPWNLEIMTAEENRLKSDRLPRQPCDDF